jgi:hypothetical protein
MKRISGAAALIAALLAATPGWAAEEWGLPEEEKARFEAKVVDVLCELTGDCPADCGAGARQLGLVTDAGVLVLPVKNFTAFSGAAAELIDFCGKRVVADGLFTTNRGARIFALQFVKEAPDGKWRRANRFLPKWAEANGFQAGGPEAKQWFRHDPHVKAVIGRDGVLGLGPETDKEYLEKQ